MVNPFPVGFWLRLQWDKNHGVQAVSVAALAMLTLSAVSIVFSNTFNQPEVISHSVWSFNVVIAPDGSFGDFGSGFGAGSLGTWQVEL
jgi:hypothetical protein